MNMRQVAIGFLLALGSGWLFADAASAAMARPFGANARIIERLPRPPHRRSQTAHDGADELAIPTTPGRVAGTPITPGSLKPPTAITHRHRTPRRVRPSIRSARCRPSVAFVPCRAGAVLAKGRATHRLKSRSPQWLRLWRRLRGLCSPDRIAASVRPISLGSGLSAQSGLLCPISGQCGARRSTEASSPCFGHLNQLP